MIRIAILGAGRIAGIMAATLNGMLKKKPEAFELYAIAARDAARAQAFAEEYHVTRAYGSYEAMVGDKAVDLVYIATPHSHHCEHIKLCLNHGKHVLCEKSFTVNAAQAAEVFALAEHKGLLLTEAIWTRYMPSRKMIDDLIASGTIGRPTMLTANLAYEITGKERIMKPELAGGALLDVGVYTLNFASMVFGDDVERMNSTMQMTDTGVDKQASISLCYRDGRMAVLATSAASFGDRSGVIFGDKGYITIDNINNPLKLTVQDNPRGNTPARVIEAPAQITGYEYEVEACLKAIAEGRTECPEMPHAESVHMMAVMDELRAQWGLKYPCE